MDEEREHETSENVKAEHDKLEHEIREAWTRAATGRPLVMGVPPKRNEGNPPAAKKTAAGRPRKVKSKAKDETTSPKPRRRAGRQSSRPHNRPEYRDAPSARPGESARQGE